MNDCEWVGIEKCRQQKCFSSKSVKLPIIKPGNSKKSRQIMLRNYRTYLVMGSHMMVLALFLTMVLKIGLAGARQQHHKGGQEVIVDVGGAGGFDIEEFHSKRLYSIEDNSNSAASNGKNGRGHHRKGGGGGGAAVKGAGGGGGGGRGGGHRKKQQRRMDNDNGLSLWINELQLKMLSALFLPQGYSQGPIYAIFNGEVSNDLRDASIYRFLTIPVEVSHVNFTWKSGRKKFFYHFDRLQTMDDSILKAPTITIPLKGRIPAEEENFSIFLPCSPNNSGTAMFNLGLSINNRRGKPLHGTPLRLSFKKECAHRAQGPDPECDVKCGNNGFCNHHKICQCNSGYIGQYCETPFCFPQCLNGGNCTAPSVCTCPKGYLGTQCEGGICSEKCENGGKCVQKDKCQCTKGYYGLHCEYSKCNIPCKNNGRCIGNNMCRCNKGWGGNHCEIVRKQHARSAVCKRPCRHGHCKPNKTCKCDSGFYGRWCNSKIKKNHHHHQINPV